MQIEIKKYQYLTVCENSVEDIVLSTHEGQEHPKITGVILGRYNYLDCLLHKKSSHVSDTNEL